MDDRTSSEILEVKDLSIYFESNYQTVKAVDQVSFSLKRGEILGIVGESGSGKSTLAYAVLNMIPKPKGRLAGGEIIYKGINLLECKEIDSIRGRNISIILQNAMSVLDPVFTIGNQLIENIRIKSSVSKKEAGKRALEILSLLEFDSPELIMKSYPYELSGGMRQRILIGLAIANHPDIIIADEPTTALDVMVQKKIIHLLKKIVSELHISLLLITHNFGLVWEICDRAVVMQNGRVVESAEVTEIYDHPIHPYTRGLLKAIPTFESDPSKPLPTVEEEMNGNRCLTGEYAEIKAGHYVLNEKETENHA